MDLTDYRCASFGGERRGIWFQDWPLFVKIVAGREGDDESVTIEVGDMITREKLRALVDCLACGEYALEVERK